MYTTITKSSQFKIYAAVALAALLMTMLTVTLAVGKAQATTTTTTTIAPSSGGDDNSIPQQQGTATPTPARHATPEACPGETGNTNTLTRVVDSGHYAIFDVYWNPDEGELTNNPCPPNVTHVPAEEDDDGNVTPARDDRSPSGINIAETIIHIPNSAKVNLTDSDTPYTQFKYPKVWDADDAENPDGDGDRLVWALPACPPDGPSTGSLCLSFSAALLNPSDWTNAAGSSSSRIEYHIDHVHQIDIDEQDPRYVLAYDAPATGATGPFTPLWNTSDADSNVMRVAPGEYERPIWFFTSPGTFEFQVHIKGYPNLDLPDGLAPVSSERSVTGDVREYIFHVGAEADVSVGVVVTPESPSPGDSVAITITASNVGPDTAPSAEVDVTLPQGLTYSSHAPAADAFAESDGVRTWDTGSLVSGESRTLTVTAAVGAETRGRTLDVEATITATETVEAGGEQHEVPVADPDISNNTAAASVTVASSSNVNPIFGIRRAVNENAPGGAAVGDPIRVVDADSADALQFTLEGADAEYFTVSNVGGGAQIAVKPNLYLNYEETPNMFSFMLHVSDLKDGNGNDDTETDDSIAVMVSLNDIEETGRLAMIFYSDPYPPVAGTNMRMCVSPEDYPGSANLPFNYLWQVRHPGEDVVHWTHNTGNSNCLNIFKAEPVTREYRAIGFTPPNGDTRNAIESAWNTVTWHPSGN